MRLYLVIALLVALPRPVLAGPLSFDQALAEAARNAPSLEARRHELDARRSAAIAAGQLPDPKLDVGLSNFPVSGAPAFSFSDAMMTMERVGIEQDMPNLAKRHAREARAVANIGAAMAQQAMTVRQLKVATALAWIELAYAQRRVVAIDEVLRRIGHLAPAVTSAVASGTARPGQSLAVQQALASLEDRRSAILAELGQASAQVTRWTVEKDPVAVGDIPPFLVTPPQLRAELERHPDLQMASARVDQANADTDLARAEKRPDWGFNAAFARRDPRYGNMVSVGASVTLPLFPGRRQNPLIEASRAQAAAARADEADVRRALAADLDAGLALHSMYHEQWTRARDTLQPLARKDADLEIASYSAGRAGLIDVIAAQTASATAQLDTLDREAALLRQSARLVLTFGSYGQ